MKKSLYRFLVFLILIDGTIISCTKSHHYMNNAVITGFDARMCMCCGGLMINLDDSTRPYAGNFYLSDQLPYPLGINNDSHFPIYVKMDWELQSKCGGYHIRILRIARR